MADINDASAAATGDGEHEFTKPIVENDPGQRAVMDELLSGGSDEVIEIPSMPNEPTDDGEGPTNRQSQDQDSSVKEPAVIGEREPLQSDQLFVEVNHRGKKLQIPVESEEHAEVLRAKFQTAEQLPHLQEKYTSALERLANTDETGRVRTGAEAADSRPATIDDLAAMDPEQFSAFTAPLVETYSKMGVFGEEAEFAAAFPQLASSLSLVLAFGIPALQTLDHLRQGFAGMTEKAQAKEFFLEVDSAFESLASKGGAFEPLKDQSQRRDFYGYLLNLGVVDNRLMDPEFLGAQWRAFNHKVFDKIEDDASAIAARKRQTELARSRGAGPTRGGGSVDPATTGNPQIDLMRKLLTN